MYPSFAPNYLSYHASTVVMLKTHMIPWSDEKTRSPLLTQDLRCTLGRAGWLSPLLPLAAAGTAGGLRPPRWRHRSARFSHIP